MLTTHNFEDDPRAAMELKDLQRIASEPARDSSSALDRAERRALRLLALHELALAIGGQSDSSQTLELILEEARTLLRAPAGSIYLWEQPDGPLRCTVAHGVPAGVLGGSVAPGEGCVGMAFGECKTVLINNYQSWTGASDLGLDTGVEAAASVPLRLGQRMLGTLTVHTYEAGQTFDEEDAWLLELIGDQASMALEQARLVEQAERRAARLLALHRVSTSISAETDITATLNLILSQAAQILKRDGSMIHLWDEPTGRLELAGAYGFNLDGRASSLGPGEDIVGRVWLGAKPLTVDDYPEWEHATSQGRASGVSSVAGVPLVVAGRQLGVLAVVTMGSGLAFTPEEVQFLELFAGQAAVAIENTRLLEAHTRARALEELNRLKSEFISTVSHELRTPLTYIHGYSELLREREFEPDTVRQAVGEIYSSSGRMARLVDDLLDLSRFEAGRLTLRPTAFDLADLLQSAVAAARIQTPERQIDLALDTLPQLVADPDRLRQVVDNLISNAQRYAPAGSILIRACAWQDGVRVEVLDQGPGIAAEERDRVFEPFYRGARSEVLPLRGGGLGLAIVRRLVEAHGGHVGLESRPGHGSSFWFTIPPAPPGALVPTP